MMILLHQWVAEACTNETIRLMNGMREELKCVLMESGGQCVRVVGIEVHLMLFSDNWEPSCKSQQYTKSSIFLV